MAGPVTGSPRRTSASGCWTGRCTSDQHVHRSGHFPFPAPNGTLSSATGGGTCVARSRAAVAGVALGLLVPLSGCGFAEALAPPEAQRAAQQAADGGPPPVPAAAPSTPA